MLYCLNRGEKEVCKILRVRQNKQSKTLSQQDGFMIWVHTSDLGFLGFSFLLHSVVLHDLLDKSF